MPKAIHVRKDNVDYIKEYARQRGFNLDTIDDEAEYYAEEGYELYLITDGTSEDRNVTFTTFIEPDFRDLWKFKEWENPNMFVPIERV